ncbi:VOC family protein [Pseudonocardia saturnea]
MGIELNHTIVTTRDRAAGARWLAEVLGLPEPVAVDPFHAVELANGVTLDFMTTATVAAQHYAFLVGEAEFDEVSARLAGRGIATFADPFHREPGHNTHGGGRGLYFDSPDGHNLEILTRAPGG